MSRTVTQRRAKQYTRVAATKHVDRYIGWEYIQGLLDQVKPLLEEKEKKWRDQLKKNKVKQFDGFNLVPAWTYQKVFGGQYREIYADEQTILEHKAFIVTLLKMGCRISELIGLRTDSKDDWETNPLEFDQIDFEKDPQWVNVKGMRVNKRYRKTQREKKQVYTKKVAPSQAMLWRKSKNRPGEYFRKTWVTKRKDVFRSFRFPAKEKYNNILKAWCEVIETQHITIGDEESKFLFTRPYHYWYAFLRDLDIMEEKYPSIEWPHIYPHWFRAQRASQLAQEYKLDINEIGNWGKWETLDVVRKYVGTEQTSEEKMLAAFEDEE